MVGVGTTGALAWALLPHNLSLAERATRIPQGDRSVTIAGNPRWLPDGRRWLNLTPGPLSSRLEMQSLDVPDGSIDLDAPAAADSLLGVTPDYRVVLSDFVPGSDPAPRRGNLFLFGIYPNAQPVQKFAFHAPPGAEVWSIALAPQGDRLAWTFRYHHIPPLRQLMARFLPSLRKNLHPVFGLGIWVSRVDGTGLHEIGYQGCDADSQWIPPFTEVCWTSDGKRLRFRYKDALYTVPAE